MNYDHTPPDRRKAASVVTCCYVLAGYLLLKTATSFQPVPTSVHYGVRPTTSTSFASPRIKLLSSRTQHSMASKQASTFENSSSAKKSTAQTPVAVLLCPAQFCVPADYEILFQRLEQVYPTLQTPNDKAGEQLYLGECRVAPLARTDWIKVAQSLPTMEFVQARLPVVSTLSWYFQAIETALTEIFAAHAQEPNLRICIIGHSIGGWVARAYLGGLSQSSTAVYKLLQERCTSFITLGTPHVSPETAWFDQTRGLLREIDQAPGCQPQALVDRGIEITCVCSNGLRSNWASVNAEELLAAGSYFPQLGRLASNTPILGDGIVPLDLAFMEAPARRLIIEQCLETQQTTVRHSHVLPTPWNLWDGMAPSIRLPESYPSYVSPGVLPQWASYIR